MQNFGVSFRAARAKSRKTLREVSEYVGKSIGYLSDVEQGRKGPPTIDVVEKIEQILGIKDSSLVSLATHIRKTFPEIVQQIQTRPKLSAVLLRAEQMSDEELEELLKEMNSDDDQGD